MKTSLVATARGLLLFGLILSACTQTERDPAAPDVEPAFAVVPSVVAKLYAIDFVAPAATGEAMNDAGDIAGYSYPDPGCGPFCLPPLQTVVWRGSTRIVLPGISGFQSTTVRSINAQAWVAGFAGVTGTTTRAVVWRPTSATTYSAINLGVLPGTTVSEAFGIDDLNRAVGWSTTGAIATTAGPFRWTLASGLVNLTTLGFPNDIPLAISPRGAVATPNFWYQLGNPGSVVKMPPTPQGFFPPGTFPTAINDAGDQARFLVATTAGQLKYLFRFHHEGTWQQISSAPTGNLSAYDVGSIDAARDITATVQSSGVVAPGPNGLAQPLTPLLSPAYQGAAVTRAGPINNSGQILASVLIGRDDRLVRLMPATRCAANCIRVSQLTMTGKFVQDPANPGRCVAGGPAFNRVTARVVVTDENAVRLAGARINGRFMDEYWTNAPVTGTTNSNGVVQFSRTGPCGVGAVTFLVERATLNARIFDRTVGVLTRFVIPQ